MANWRQEQIDITTDASGDATVYTEPFTGRVVNVLYTKTDFATGVDFAITAEQSGLGVWSEDNVDASTSRAPSQIVHDNTGTATALYDSVVLVNDRIKFVISNGGATKVGRFRVIYQED